MLFYLLFGSSFSGFSNFCACTCRWYQANDSSGPVLGSLELSFYVSLTSLLLYPVKSVYLSLPNFWTLSSPICETARLCFGSPFLQWHLATLQAVSWGISKTHLICVPSLRDHCLALLVAQCLKTVVLYIFI